MARRTNPFEELERLVERMGRGVDEFDLGTPLPVDLVETDDAYVVTADLPGYERDDVDVRVSDRTLTLEAERERGDVSGDLLRDERVHRPVSRELRLPGPVEETAASAELAEGVLRVRLPKRTADEGDGHRIDVE